MNIRLLLAVTAPLLLACATATLALSEEAEAPAEKATTHAPENEESDFTLLEVMNHLAASQQQIQTGLLMNNRLMIAKGAYAIAHHPHPKGGIEPYVKTQHGALKGTIEAMDSQVHGTAKSMLKQSANASMTELQDLNHQMISACISCHNVFRD